MNYPVEYLSDIAEVFGKHTENLTGRVKKASSSSTGDHGTGNYTATLSRGTLKPYGSLVAIKVPKIIDIPWEDFMICQLEELGTWVRPNHKNVLPLLGYCTDLSPALCMISPWMSNGTVDEYVKTHGDADTVKLIEGMARGLDYLHGQNIVHGDLRCSNILVSDEKEAVISGIGMARLTLHMTTLPTIHESHRWRAPEVHLPPKFGLTIEDALALPADVWAFGMTILELLTGEAPYDELKSDDDVSITIISGLIPREPTPPAPSDTAKLKLIDTLWPFCLQCWAHYPASRPTMKDSVQSLRRLSRNDAYYSAHEVLERMETETNRVADGFWGAYVAGKARSLFHIIISLIVASAVLVWGVLNNGDWQMGLLSPWLVGSTTWLALRYERNPSPVTLNGIAWKIGKTIHTAVLGIMCLDFLIGQLSVDLAFPRLFPFGLPTGFGTAQGKATRRDL